ncbi:MAG: transporter substrate-binding domain-containing protein [Rhodospirillales bacterium]|nr:transporter substrate-binding domain-containing protein [Alphaproteobacteria bacterium]MCB9987342.1 transporter substrate-binding domain-containing protein [Rhodospirillales bacterium]USO07807.1 MAG: transporter substrate-binding domain-containing protein [Rhodospirillales bacterium]
MKRFFLILLLAPVLWGFCTPANAESAYQRVQRTGTIRCGYLVWTPMMQVDPNTGALSGMNYEYMEAVAKTLGLKIDWVREVPPGQQVEELRTGTIDAICSADGPLVPAMARYVFYTRPIARFPFRIYMRKGDPRLKEGMDKLNADNIRFTIVDGDLSGSVIGMRFPKAKRLSLAMNADPSQMMMDVVTRKADALINDDFTMAAYLKSNPDALQRVEPDIPVADIPNAFSVLQGPDGLPLKTLLDQGIENVKNFGIEAEIFKNYGINPQD